MFFASGLNFYLRGECSGGFLLPFRLYCTITSLSKTPSHVFTACRISSSSIGAYSTTTRKSRSKGSQEGKDVHTYTSQDSFAWPVQLRLTLYTTNSTGLRGSGLTAVLSCQ